MRDSRGNISVTKAEQSINTYEQRVLGSLLHRHRTRSWHAVVSKITELPDLISILWGGVAWHGRVRQ